MTFLLMRFSIPSDRLYENVVRRSSMELIAGKYIPLRELGEGGSGKVLLVRHVDLGVQYALKILKSDAISQPMGVERFKKEAALLLSFNHPRDAQVRDFGKTLDGSYYMAMDYCQGESIRHRIDAGHYFSFGDTLRIAMQVLGVLDVAHSAGIIHGDIKPENLFLESTEEGELCVKVLDFGTAFLRQQLGDDQIVFGTPCYMSPEQAAGEEEIDHRVDFYSLGIVLFELIAGKVPFEGDNVVQTLILHLTQPLPSLAEEFGVSDTIEKVVRKALAKSPAERFPNAGEFQRQCEEALTVHEGEVLAAAGPNCSLPKTQSAVNVLTKPTEGVNHPTRILCLDDDEMILNILQHVLEREGYEVITAQHSSEIHEYLFNSDIDLLVSDVQMPGIPGTKVCRLLKKSMSDLKVILFSNVPEIDLERYSAENNADGWISKQRLPKEWLGEIKRVLFQ